MNDRALKSHLYNLFANVGKALASSRRLELLDLLAQGERHLEALATETGMSAANTSQHLKVLTAAGLVQVRRQGLHAHFRLADESVFALLRQVERVGELQMAEVEKTLDLYIHQKDNMQPMEAAELFERLQAGDVLLIDVRPVEEFRQGHIPGAISVPVPEFDGLQNLPAGKPVVAYCRGPYCVFSAQAVQLLRRRGFEARRLEQGLPDWAALGLPITVSEVSQP